MVGGSQHDEFFDFSGTCAELGESGAGDQAAHAERLITPERFTFRSRSISLHLGSGSLAQTSWLKEASGIRSHLADACG
jgi:hypothetical protein